MGQTAADGGVMLGFWNYQDRLLERCEWAFAEPVVLYPAGKDPAGYPVRGIFDTPPEHADLGLTRDLSNQAPWVAFRVVELPDVELPQQGMQFEARAARWEVVDVEPDGSGHVRCRAFRIGPGSTAPLPPVDWLAPIPDLVGPRARWGLSKWRECTWV
jgi:hypothetical protein